MAKRIYMENKIVNADTLAKIIEECGTEIDGVKVVTKKQVNTMINMMHGIDIKATAKPKVEVCDCMPERAAESEAETESTISVVEKGGSYFNC